MHALLAADQHAHECAACSHESVGRRSGRRCGGEFLIETLLSRPQQLPQVLHLRLLFGVVSRDVESCSAHALQDQVEEVRRMNGSIRRPVQEAANVMIAAAGEEDRHIEARQRNGDVQASGA